MCLAMSSKDERQKEENCIQHMIVANFIVYYKLLFIFLMSLLCFLCTWVYILTTWILRCPIDYKSNTTSKTLCTILCVELCETCMYSL
jgi:hypothetical protein